MAGVGDEAGGSLHAMMLDMKRTFDEVVEAHADPGEGRQILANPFYQSVSSSFAGTQEYMAMEKLGQLRTEAERDGTWDLIVVDTPPSRSALDFLDAPKRLGSFLDGRFIRLLSAPARAGGRAYLRFLGRGRRSPRRRSRRCSAASCSPTCRPSSPRSTPCSAGSASGPTSPTRCSRSRPRRSSSSPRPERDALREAAYFVERLESEGMPLAGLVVNRMQTLAAPALSGSRAAAASEQLEDRDAER